tara:strand:+ start:48 stop:590 length:543 start_codon:yes stop_codon:yes gene_type:complete
MNYKIVIFLLGCITLIYAKPQSYNTLKVSKLELSHTPSDSSTITTNKKISLSKNSESYSLQQILNAIIQVESKGNNLAYCSSEDAVGCLQIRRCMVSDINRILKRKGNTTRYSFNDRWDRNKSIEMFYIYCDYYNLITDEEISRCWNGGPKGINKSQTIKYWSKVKKELNSRFNEDNDKN